MRRWTRSEIRILRPLGGGGGGDVYLAKLLGPHQFEMTVVLKLARASSPGSHNGLIDEARLLARLEHPNIVRIFEHGLCELSEAVEVPYAMLEYGGAPLQQLQKSCLRFDPQLAAYVAIEVCSGLAHAHEQGVVHRDIKPENVMVNRHGEVKLIDLGIAKADDRIQSTHSGQIKGTPHYLAPEIIQGLDPDARVDLWSVGVLLFEMLTGSAPWVAPDVAERMERYREITRQILSAPMPPLPAGLPAGLCAVVERLLNKDREQRYATAQEVGQALLPFAVSWRVARGELGQHARANEDAATRQPHATHTGRTVPALASMRQPPELVSFSLAPMRSNTESGDGSSGSEMWSSGSLPRVQPEPQRVGASRHPLGGAPAPAADDDDDDRDITEVLYFARSSKKLLWLGAAAVLIVLGVTGLALRRGVVQVDKAASAAPQIPARPGQSTPTPDSAATPPPDEASPALSAPLGSAAREPEASTAAAIATEAASDTKQGRPRVSHARVSDTSAAEARASLTVTVLPRGSFVALDNQPAVPAPATYEDLRPGRHVLRLGAERDRLTRSEQVKLSAGRNQLDLVLADPFTSGSP